MSDLDKLLDSPKRHLRRIAPPWSAQDQTACGRPVDDVATCLTYDEAKKMVDRYGKARVNFLFCQTCLSRFGQVGEAPARWEGNPARVVADWARHAGWYWSRNEGASDSVKQVRAELLALADLAAAHADEYAAAVARHLVPDALAERRAARKGPR